MSQCSVNDSKSRQRVREKKEMR